MKNRDCWKSCEYANPKAELIGQYIKDIQKLIKAKEIIRELLKALDGRSGFDEDVFGRAEKFLKEK